MHPILADGRRLAAYMAASLPLAAVLAGLSSRGPRPIPLVPAALLALPLAVLALIILLPVWYVCRAAPVDGSAGSRLLATHAGSAAVTSALWFYLGSGLTRAVAAYYPDAGLVTFYTENRYVMLATGALLYLLSASFHYMLLAASAMKRAEQQKAEMAVLAREAELKALKAQVHPHFLFNSLNSISALVSTDPMRARELCILLAEFFRKSLALGDKTNVTLEEELAVAKTYLGIESLRLGPRLTVEESVEPRSLACRVPPLLLQPLVENAIRHGIATCVEGGVLRLTAQTDGRRLRLLVENPFDPDAPARPGVGLGLRNVRGRLLARYGDNAMMDAQRLADRFRVMLLLPAEGVE